MIQWATARPVAYEFTTSSFHSITFTKDATNVSQMGAQRGSSYTSYKATINEGGTTEGATYESGFSHTFSTFVAGGNPANQTSQSTTGGSASQSGSTANSHSVTTSATTTMETQIVGIATTTFDGGTAWTTSTFTTWSGANTTELTTFSTYATSYFTFSAGDPTTVTVETETTITNGETALGNVFDTVLKDSNTIFIFHTNAATDFDSFLEAASALDSTTGTQVIASHQVGAVAVSFTNITETEFVTLEVATIFSEVLNFQYQANGLITITDNIDPTKIPNSTTQRAVNVTTVNETETITNQFVVGGGVGPSALVVSDTAVFASAYTYSNFLKNPTQSPAQTFAEIENRAISVTVEGFYPHVQPTYSTTFVETIFGPTTSQTIISAGGGNTTAVTKVIAPLGYNQFYDQTPVYEAGVEEEYSTILPVCAVYKPYGVYVGDELFLAASLTGTTLTGVQVVGLSRGGIYPEAIAPGSAVEQPAASFQANRFILSYPDQSNDSFTISGKSVSYTRTTTVISPEITTTISQTEEMFGTYAAGTGYIGERRWFGGSPEESATYYESIARGVYVDQTGGTSYFTGGYTSYAGESRPLKIWQPVMAAGGGIGGGQFTHRPAFPGASYCFLAP